MNLKFLQPIAAQGRHSGYLLWLFCNLVYGANYYLDPAVGLFNNPGSADDPWGTLESVLKEGKSLQGGDTLFLQTGNHGSILAQGVFAPPLVVAAAPGQNPKISQMVLDGAEGWHFSGLEISPVHATEYYVGTLVHIQNDSHENRLTGLRVFSVPDIADWTLEDWNDLPSNGIRISGNYNEISHCIFLNINFGISVEGQYNTVTHNTVENFSGDGMRGLGDYNTFAFNLVKNSYAVNDNHDDGFQSWSEGDEGPGSGVVLGMVLRGNTIINYSDPNQPFRGTLQGIGCFDGFFEDWVVENNVVITDHWHGITFMGAVNVRIINNTVVDINSDSPGPPWIRIAAHKSGAASSGNVVKNNLATAYSSDSDIGLVENNLVVENAEEFFMDYAGFDVRLRENSPAIGAGTADMAPAEDIIGTPRNSRVDAGAYQFLEGQLFLKEVIYAPAHPEMIPLWTQANWVWPKGGQYFNLAGRRINQP